MLFFLLFLDGSHLLHGEDIESEISQCASDSKIFEDSGIVSISQWPQIGRHDFDNHKTEGSADDSAYQLPDGVFDD